jgi:hypothetical protein
MKYLTIAVIAALLAVSGAAYSQSRDQWREREVEAAERASRAAERQAAAAEAHVKAARWEKIERCFARGERERCIAMMTSFEAANFAAMEASERAGRGLGEVLRALSGARTAEEERSALARLRALHPDYEQILADPAFRRWIADSTNRQELLQKAHTEFDVEAADMLFVAWKRVRAAY